MNCMVCPSDWETAQAAEEQTHLQGCAKTKMEEKACTATVGDLMTP